MFLISGCTIYITMILFKEVKKLHIFSDCKQWEISTDLLILVNSLIENKNNIK